MADCSFPILGSVFIFAGPSGVGKTTIIQKLIKKNPEFHYARSATTRPRRTRDEHYLFLSKDAFQTKVNNGEFIEHVECFGYHYGTLKSEVYDHLADGEKVILDVDAVQGFPKLLSLLPGSLGVGVIPSNDRDLSMQALRNRMKQRGDTDVSIEKRLKDAEKEMDSIYMYADFIVENSQSSIEAAVENAQSIITAYEHVNHYKVKRDG